MRLADLECAFEANQGGKKKSSQKRSMRTPGRGASRRTLSICPPVTRKASEIGLKRRGNLKRGGLKKI